MDEEDRREAQAMYKRGVATSIIADLLGISHKKLLQELELDKKPRQPREYDIANMVKDWNAWAKPSDMAKKYGFRTRQELSCFVSHNRELGFSRRRGSASDKAQSLVDDWNRGVNAAEIVTKYNFKDARSLGNALSHLRRKGYTVDKRVGGTEKKRNNILRRRDGRL